MTNPSKNSLFPPASPFSLPSSNVPTVSGTPRSPPEQAPTPFTSPAQTGGAPSRTRKSPSSRQRTASPLSQWSPHNTENLENTNSDSDTNVAKSLVDWRKVLRNANLRDMVERRRAAEWAGSKGSFSRTRESKDEDEDEDEVEVEDDRNWNSADWSSDDRDPKSKPGREQRRSVVGKCEMNEEVKKNCLTKGEERGAKESLEEWEEIWLSCSFPKEKRNERDIEEWKMIEEEECEDEWTMIEGEDVEDDWDMFIDAERFRIGDGDGLRREGIDTRVGKREGRLQTWNGRMREFFEGERRKREREFAEQQSGSKGKGGVK